MNSDKNQKRISVTSIRISAALSLVAISLLVLTNCSKQNNNAPSDTSIAGDSQGLTAIALAPTYSSLYANVFSKRCAECHRPGGSANSAGAQLDFSSAASGYSTMVNQSVSGITSASVCSSAKIVVGNVNSSYILATFFSGYGLGSNNWGGIAGCTPYDHTAFQTSVPSGAEKSALIQWISSGAANN